MAAKKKKKVKQSVGPPSRPTAHGERLMFRKKAGEATQTLMAGFGTFRANLAAKERAKKREEMFDEESRGGGRKARRKKQRSV